MEFKTITEAVDCIAVLQRKAQEYNASDELKNDMATALKALDEFIKKENAEKEVVFSKKSNIALTRDEFIDYMILKCIDEREVKAKNRLPMPDVDLLKFAIKDEAKIKSLTTTSTMTDWIPTEFQKDVIDYIISNTATISDFLVNVFRWSTGSNKRDYPYVDWYASFYTVEGSTITESNPDDLKFNLIAKPFKGMYKWTDETDMFTVIEMLPILRNALYIGLGLSIEDSMINGDTGISAPDPKSNWMGFRKLALTASLSADMSTFNITNFRALRQKLGSWGVRPSELLIVAQESKAYFTFLNDTNFLTIDKVGAKATILNGQLGIYDGMPLRTSVVCPLTNATGEVDATPANNTKGSFLIINKRPFAVGFYGTPIIEWDKDITSGVNYLVMRQYFAFTKAFATTKGVCVGYNM